MSVAKESAEFLSGSASDAPVHECLEKSRKFLRNLQDGIDCGKGSPEAYVELAIAIATLCTGPMRMLLDVLELRQKPFLAQRVREQIALEEEMTKKLLVLGGAKVKAS